MGSAPSLGGYLLFVCVGDLQLYCSFPLQVLSEAPQEIRVPTAEGPRIQHVWAPPYTCLTNQNKGFPLIHV